jgi:hypothetical protein
MLDCRGNLYGRTYRNPIFGPKVASPTTTDRTPPFFLPFMEKFGFLCYKSQGDAVSQEFGNQVYRHGIHRYWDQSIETKGDNVRRIGLSFRDAPLWLRIRL